MEFIVNYHILILLYLIMPFTDFSYSSKMEYSKICYGKCVLYIFFPPYLWYFYSYHFLEITHIPRKARKFIVIILCLMWYILFSGFVGSLIFEPKNYLVFPIIIWFYYPLVTISKMLLFYIIKRYRNRLQNEDSGAGSHR